MAAGDIKSVAVNADGGSVNVTIDGWAGKQGLIAYDFGSFDDVPALPTDPRIVFHVVSEGYDSAGVLGTRSRTVYGTHAGRLPYNQQAQKHEIDSGADLVVRVWLSESIYNDDKAGTPGVHSGTDPTVTIAAGWATEGANQSAAVLGPIGMVCTNGSGLDYPKMSSAQWAFGHTPVFRRVTEAFTIGCIAYHGHGIACVALSATDAHAATVSGKVTTKTDHVMSASGLHYESYDLAVPVTSFTEGDDITLRFIAYPLVGDADSIVDTSADPSTTNIAKGKTVVTVKYKTTGLVTKYVGTTGTNDTAAGRGDTAGNPYLTTGYALSKNPDVVIVKAGTYDLLGSTPASVAAKTYCIEVMPDTGASVTLNRNYLTGYDFKARHLRYSGFTIASAGEAFSLSSAAAYTLQFADSTLTFTTLPGQNMGDLADATIYVNNTFTGRDNWYAPQAATDIAAVGNSIIGGDFRTVHSFVANKVEGNGTNDQTLFQDRASGLQQSNYLFCNNKLTKLKMSGSPAYKFGSLFPVVGAAFIGNILECTTFVGTQLFSWFESTPSYASDSTIVAHNTLVGQRSNVYYNDNGTTAVLQTNAFFRNNAIQNFNVKADLYAPQNGNRTGNWAFLNGVNCSDNRFDATAGFPQDWDGINVAYVTAEDTVVGQLGFTDDNSSAGDATGNGDYMPTEASVLGKYEPQQMYQSFDLYGTPL